MKAMEITPTSKKELKDAVTTPLRGTNEVIYNWFEGKIHKGDRYAKVSYRYRRDKLKIEITYWQDGRNCAIETSSMCSSYKGLVNKVANFLNLK